MTDKYDKIKLHTDSGLSEEVVLSYKDVGNGVYAKTVVSANPALVYGRTVTIAAGKGNTPVPLDNIALINSVVIKARASNAGDVIISGIGDDASKGYPLSPGEPIGFSVTNLSAIQIYGAVGDGIHWTGN